LLVNFGSSGDGSLKISIAVHNRDILSALTAFHHNVGNPAAASTYAETLRIISR
jgi:hypothetical protein